MKGKFFVSVHTYLVQARRNNLWYAQYKDIPAEGSIDREMGIPNVVAAFVF